MVGFGSTKVELPVEKNEERDGVGNRAAAQSQCEGAGAGRKTGLGQEIEMEQTFERLAQLIEVQEVEMVARVRKPVGE